MWPPLWRPFSAGNKLCADGFLRSRHDAAIEIISLRQQVAVLKRKQPRPKLNTFDRLFWTTCAVCGPGWPRSSSPLSQRPWSAGIAPVSALLEVAIPAMLQPTEITGEIRVQLRRLVEEDPDWGAPNIRGKLRKLGLEVFERTVAQYLRGVQLRGVCRQALAGFAPESP